MAAVFHIITDFLKQFIAGNIQRWNNDQPVIPEFSVFRKDKVDTHIVSVKHSVKLADQIATVDIVPIFERHHVQCCIGIVAKQNSHSVGDFQIN